MEDNKYRKIIDIGTLNSGETKTFQSGLIFDNNNCILEKIEGYIEYSNNVFLSFNGNLIINNASGEITVTNTKDEKSIGGYVILNYKKQEEVN